MPTDVDVTDVGVCRILPTVVSWSVSEKVGQSEIHILWMVLEGWWHLNIWTEGNIYIWNFKIILKRRSQEEWFP
jgi:hypothetical protein